MVAQACAKGHLTQTEQPEPQRSSNALKERAQAVLNDRSIDPQTRAVIRYALETNDPLLAELVLRAEAGETVIDSDGFLEKFGRRRVLNHFPQPVPPPAAYLG